MQRAHTLHVTSAGVLLVTTAPLAPAAPLGTAFSYQGRLTLNGTPTNDTCDFVFTLWDDLAAGGQVGTTLTFDGQGGNPAPITVTNGAFTVQLDFGSTVFLGDARWLEVSVRCPPGAGTYQTLSPRQPLLAVPYALYARSSPGGILTLPFAGSFAGSDQTAFSIEQTGLGYAASFNSSDAGNYYGAVAAFSRGPGPSVFATHSAGASCARFQNVVQANNVATLHATTFGPAPAILGDAGVGTNGIGVSGVGQGTGDGIRGSALGTGLAGRFDGSVLAESSSWAVRGVKTGSGSFPGVWGETQSTSADATGVRGYVSSTSPGSGSAGVWGRNFGTTSNGSGVRGTHDGRGVGVSGAGFFGVSGSATDPDGYGGSFGGSGFLGSGNALLVWGEAHLLSTVGIGTSNPGVRLDVASGNQQDGGIRVTTSARDAGLQLSNTNGANYFVYTTGPGSVNGAGSLAFGRVGQAGDIVLSQDGRVGIGGVPTSINYTSGAFRPLLTVHGNIRVEDVPVWDGPNAHDLTWGAGASGGVSFSPDRLLISREGSSRRYKKEIQRLDDDFSMILKVEAKRYQMQEGYGPPDTWEFGYLAEDLEEAGLRNFVIYDRKGKPDGVKYKKVALYVNEVVKVHQKKIERLEAELGSTQVEAAAQRAEIRKLQNENNAFAARLERIEKLLATDPQVQSPTK